MFIAIRKESNGSLYIDKNIFKNKNFTEEELSKPPYNYTKINVPDEFIDKLSGDDFDENLNFSIEKYTKRNIELSKEELRVKRAPLLKAFDVYKSSVSYGVEFENEEQRDEIIAWYTALLHLEEIAFEVIPERIRYYL